MLFRATLQASNCFVNVHKCQEQNCQERIRWFRWSSRGFPTQEHRTTHVTCRGQIQSLSQLRHLRGTYVEGLEHCTWVDSGICREPRGLRSIRGGSVWVGIAEARVVPLTYALRCTLLHWTGTLSATNFVRHVQLHLQLRERKRAWFGPRLSENISGPALHEKEAA